MSGYTAGQVVSPRYFIAMSRENLKEFESELRNLSTTLVRRNYDRISTKYDQLKSSKPRLKVIINMYRQMLEIAEREIERREINPESGGPRDL